MRFSMPLDSAALVERDCLVFDLAVMQVPLHQTRVGRTLTGSRSVPAILCVQFHTTLHGVENIKCILDSLHFAGTIGRSCKQFSGSRDQFSPGFFDAQW